MEYHLTGDYFYNQYQKSHAKQITKYSPANTDHLLWNLNYSHSYLDEVVDSAQQGFKKWCPLSIQERSQYLLRYKNIIVKKQEEIAKAISLEVGKPLWESRIEARALGEKVDVTLKDSLCRINSQSFENILPNTRGEIYYRPIGPTLIIGPFNFPCHLANGQILSSLLAGNSIIFKPSEKTAYSAQLLIDCFAEVEFPSGVINLTQGDGEIARSLIQKSDIKGVFFTGSKNVGKMILKETSQDLSKLVALELGGKNTTIIHSDANVDFAMKELLKSCFLTSGQRCTSTSIVAIHHNLKNEFIDKFHKLVQKIIIDHPIVHKKEPFMGPLIDQPALNAYTSFMNMAKSEGFQEITKGQITEQTFPGYYATPSIHYNDQLKEKSPFIESEIFGPTATFIPYYHIEEAISIANTPNYGLATSVFTDDDTLFTRCASSIITGLINKNRSTIGASSKLPFGGMKDSGNYRPAAVSMIDSCVYPQSCLKVDSPIEPTLFSDITGLDL